jgi:hypothetical protein
MWNRLSTGPTTAHYSMPYFPNQSHARLLQFCAGYIMVSLGLCVCGRVRRAVRLRLAGEFGETFCRPCCSILSLTMPLPRLPLSGRGEDMAPTLGHIHSGHRLTHVAFADDQTLLARSWTSLKIMIPLLEDALQERSLSLHPSTCKAQTNLSDTTHRGQISLSDTFAIDALPLGEYLELLRTCCLWVMSLSPRSKLELRKCGDNFGD